MLRFSKSPAVVMALTVALAACTDGLGLDDAPFDPDASAADLQIVQGAFADNIFESLAVSGGAFLVADTTSPAPVSLLRASFAVAGSDTEWEAAAAAQAFLAAGPAAGPFIRPYLFGRTYDRGPEGYRHNELRTDAPANGVRFILYAIDPVTREPSDVEIGYVDLLDESTDLARVVRVVAVTDGVERINYTVSATIGSQTAGFAVVGFISDGTDVVEIDLSMSFVEDGPVSVATVEHLIAVPTRNFEVDARVVFTHNRELLTGSVNVDATFMQGRRTVTVVGGMEFSDGDVPTRGGGYEITVDGQPFATITMGGGSVTVTSDTGSALTAGQRAAVRSIFDGLEDLFDNRFEDFVRPVAWLFEAA